MQEEEDGDADFPSKVRLVVPNSSCGGIIGKGGSIIKYNVVLVPLFFPNMVGLVARI